MILCSECGVEITSDNFWEHEHHHYDATKCPHIVSTDWITISDMVSVKKCMQCRQELWYKYICSKCGKEIQSTAEPKKINYCDECQGDYNFEDYL